MRDAISLMDVIMWGQFRFAGVGAVVILAGASISANFWFGMRLMTGYKGVLFGVMFAALDAVKCCLLPASEGAFSAGQKSKGLTAVALFAGLSVLSFTAELGLYAGSRSDVIGEKTAAHATFDNAKEAKLGIEAELAGLGLSSRQPGEVEADLAKLKLDARFVRSKECANVTVDDSRTLCGEIATLTGELAKGRLKSELSSKLDRIREKIGGLDIAAASVPIDPQGAALAAFLRPVAAVEPSSIRDGLAVLIALLIELGSGLGIWLMSVREPLGAVPQLAATPAEGAVSDTAPLASAAILDWIGGNVSGQRGSTLKASDIRAAMGDGVSAALIGKAMKKAGFVAENVGGRVRYQNATLQAARPALAIVR